jgi:hypothetical protein
MKRLLLTTAAILAGFATAGPANAALQLAITVGTTTVTCVDNAACDNNPATGILFLGDRNIGGLDFTGSAQTSTGTIRTPAGGAFLNTSSLQIHNATAAPLIFSAAISDTDFIGPATLYNASSSATFQSAAGSTLTQSFYDDPANRQGATTPGDHPGDLLATTTKNVTLVTDAHAFVATGGVTDAGLFSMTEVISGSLVAGGFIINNGLTETKTAAIAEPASLGMLGLGTLAIGATRRRRAV